MPAEYGDIEEQSIRENTEPLTVNAAVSYQQSIESDTISTVHEAVSNQVEESIESDTIDHCFLDNVLVAEVRPQSTSIYDKKCIEQV